MIDPLEDWQAKGLWTDVVLPEGATIDADGIVTLPNGVDLGPVHVCRGCNRINDQQFMAEHPAGGWWHADFCMPPDNWTGPRYQ